MNRHDSTDHAAMQSDPDAAKAPYDLQFIDTMIHHHAGAVEMARIVAGKSSNGELKKFAQKIIDDQNREIAQLKQWREQWFPGAPGAVNMELAGMKESMNAMIAERMTKLETASGTDLDTLFLDLMIPHHEGAIPMSREALQKSERAEIKTLANSIIEQQQSEIRQMNEWKAKWNK